MKCESGRKLSDGSLCFMILVSSKRCDRDVSSISESIVRMFPCTSMSVLPIRECDLNGDFGFKACLFRLCHIKSSVFLRRPNHSWRN